MPLPPNFFLISHKPDLSHVLVAEPEEESLSLHSTTFFKPLGLKVNAVNLKHHFSQRIRWNRMKTLHKAELCCEVVVHVTSVYQYVYVCISLCMILSFGGK